MELPSPSAIAFLIAGGVVAGTVNTLAGAGSMVNLPLLSAQGLPHTIANATNRVAVLVQGIFALIRYQRSKMVPWALCRPLLIPTLFGSALGSWVATVVSDKWFRPIVGVELLVLGAMLVFKPKIWLEPSPQALDDAKWKRLAIFFFIGAYGGFLQIGVGFFMIAALVRRYGVDLVRANAAKMLLTLVATLVALAIFISAGMVSWVPGALLAIGNGIGGWIGAHLAVVKGAKWIRWTLVFTVLIASAEAFGLFSMIR